MEPKEHLKICTAYGEVEIQKVGHGAAISVPPSWGYGEHRTPRVDVVVSMILGHAAAGVDVTTPEYAKGIDAAMDEIVNSFEDEDEDEE